MYAPTERRGPCCVLYFIRSIYPTTTIVQRCSGAAVQTRRCTGTSTNRAAAVAVVRAGGARVKT